MEFFGVDEEANTKGNIRKVKSSSFYESWLIPCDPMMMIDRHRSLFWDNRWAVLRERPVISLSFLNVIYTYYYIN